MLVFMIERYSIREDSKYQVMSRAINKTSKGRGPMSKFGNNVISPWHWELMRN